MYVGIKDWNPGTRTLKFNIGEGALNVIQSHSPKIIANERVSKANLDVTLIILNPFKTPLLSIPPAL